MKKVNEGKWMSESRELIEVRQEIQRFKELFKEDPVEQIKNGTWFNKIVNIILTEHASKVNASYFKNKYIGLDNERIALKLVNTAAKYTSITGGLAASAASAAELSVLVTGGWSFFAFGATLIGEMSYISYLQLKLVYDISIVLDAKLDISDPEDILTIFSYAFGINIWEDVANTVLKAGPRAVAYMGRKGLRSGIRRGMQNMVAKIGGVKLAQKITEKGLLKLIVPGINVPIASALNYTFTKKLGKRAIVSLKRRGLVIKKLDELKNEHRISRIITIPLIYQIGIVDEPKEKACPNIEMQNNVVKHLNVSEEEENIIEELIEIEFNDFCKIMQEHSTDDIALCYVDIATYAHCLTRNKNKVKLEKLAQILGVSIPEERINHISSKLY